MGYHIPYWDPRDKIIYIQYVFHFYKGGIVMLTEIGCII